MAYGLTACILFLLAGMTCLQFGIYLIGLGLLASSVLCLIISTWAFVLDDSLS